MNDDRLTQIEIDLRSEAIDRRKTALDRLATFPAEIAVPILQKLSDSSDFAFCRLRSRG